MTKYLTQEIDPRQNKVYRLANTVFDDDASELLGGAWSDIVRHIWSVCLIVFILAGGLYFYEHSKWGQQHKIRHMHRHEEVEKPIMPEVETPEEVK
jgi:hypothetical protein